MSYDEIKMKEDLNLPLRSKITEIALKVEETVNSILLIHLSIENEERKAITNKSGNLSFKNKIDLLFDLEILNKEEHRHFLLLMEFRNQFLHNIECNSFVKAVLALGPDKGKSLLKFDDKNDNSDETRYDNAFNSLYKKTLGIALEKIRARKQVLIERAELLKGIVSDSINLIEYFFDLYNNLSDRYLPEPGDSLEIVNLKTQMLETITKDIMKISESKEYKSLLTNFDNSLTADKINMYFIKR